MFAKKKANQVYEMRIDEYFLKVCIIFFLKGKNTYNIVIFFINMVIVYFNTFVKIKRESL